MDIHHLGYLVDDIKYATNKMKQLGFIPISEKITDSLREVYIIFIENNGYCIELVQPISETSPIYGLRKRYKNSLYHICYKTKDLEKEISILCKQEGYMLLHNAQPACAINGTPLVAFLFNPMLGMIELLEISE